MLSKEDNEFLELYNDSDYEKPSVTVDAVIFRIKSEENSNYRKLDDKKLQVFLTKRAYSPFINQYSIVGTFIDLKTELANTMQLCVKNKVNLENYYYEQLFTFGEKSRDPRTRVISVSYMLLTNKDENLKNGEWFDIDISLEEDKKIELASGYEITKILSIKLSNENREIINKIKINRRKIGLEEIKTIDILENGLAFDHIKIIYMALDRLKNKLEYTDIIFNLMPKYFTLTELKQCYELILNEKLLDANFRRKTAKMVLATNQLEDSKGHRTSRLFTHNPSWTFNSLE